MSSGDDDLIEMICRQMAGKRNMDPEMPLAFAAGQFPLGEGIFVRAGTADTILAWHAFRASAMQFIEIARALDDRSRSRLISKP